MSILSWIICKKVWDQLEKRNFGLKRRDLEFRATQKMWNHDSRNSVWPFPLGNIQTMYVVLRSGCNLKSCSRSFGLHRTIRVYSPRRCPTQPVSSWFAIRRGYEELHILSTTAMTVGKSLSSAVAAVHSRHSHRLVCFRPRPSCRASKEKDMCSRCASASSASCFIRFSSLSIPWVNHKCNTKSENHFECLQRHSLSPNHARVLFFYGLKNDLQYIWWSGKQYWLQMGSKWYLWLTLTF